MQVFAGSHRWETSDGSPFVAGRNVFKPPNPNYDEQVRQIGALSGRSPRELAKSLVSLRVPAGALSFHTSRLVHGSRPNTSGSAERLSLVIHMIVDGTRFRGWGKPGAEHSSNVLLQPADGEHYAGPYFPVLWRQSDATSNTWASLPVAAPRL